MKFDQLVAAVIHDLKNQLQSLFDYEQEALARIPKQYHAHLLPILQRTTRLQNHTLQLVSLFRIEQKQSFTMDDAWPHDTLLYASDSITLQFPHLKIDNQIDSDCQGFYNENLLQLALITLITNSAQAGATQVTVNADDSDGLVIRVEDNGHGFDPAILKGHKETTKVGGTGLGLFFVQLIAEHHVQGEQHGYIEYGNSAKGGAFVSIHLP